MIQQVSHYQIKDFLGQGTMGVVYSAHDGKFLREVAVKLLRTDPFLPPAKQEEQQNALKRFEREAKVVASLQHYAIVPVYDFGQARVQGQDYPYMVMRLMEGGSLEKRLEQGALPLEEVVRIMAWLAPALDKVHRENIVHRDLKPANILFDEDELPALADFGIAKLVQATQITSSRATLGTPAYMSPEQTYTKAHRKVKLDGRSDIYALGAILYEMLTGKYPYHEAENVFQVMYAHRTAPVPRLDELRTDLGGAWQTVIDKAMAKQPDERYATVGELVAVLKALTSPPPPPSLSPPLLPTAATHLGAGNRYYEQRNYESAIAEYSRALLLDVNFSDGYLNRALTYHAKGQFSQSVEDYNQFIRLNATDPKGYNYRGLAYYNCGQLIDAIGDYDHALRLKPDYSDAANNRQAAVQAIMARAQSAYQQGRLDEAIADYTTLLRLNPREVSALILRGQSYYQKGQLDQALADYDQALRLNPHDKEAQKHHKVAYEAKHPPLGIGSERVCSTDGMVQVYVPAGKFLMGSRDDDPDAYHWEKPQHEVYLDAYWIDKTPVTNAMFAKFVTETGYVTEAEKAKEEGFKIFRSFRSTWQEKAGSDRENHPVVYVSWNDAVAYAKWAERRLPTEAEWEKAAGGTDERKYPWGNEEPTEKHCNFNGNISDTTPVGNYPAGASPYGALDMAGNVWEWCNDNFEEKYYASSPKVNPLGPKFNGTKVICGGAWRFPVRFLRVRDRFQSSASQRHVFLGFRCVISGSLVL